MRCLLKSPFDQNHHLINHMPNCDFKTEKRKGYKSREEVEMGLLKRGRLFDEFVSKLPIFLAEADEQPRSSK
jgi:hypothetical protein